MSDEEVVRAVLERLRSEEMLDAAYEDDAMQGGPLGPRPDPDASAALSALDSLTSQLAEVTKERDSLRAALEEIAVHVDPELQTRTFNSQQRVIEAVESIARQALTSSEKEKV